MNTLDWPDGSSVYWWMKAKTGKRTTVKILGSVVERFGEEYFQPYDDRNCYSRSICAGWQAKFLPGETPPCFA
jgi:hypothetical protein